MNELENNFILIRQLFLSQYYLDILDFILKHIPLLAIQSLRYFFGRDNISRSILLNIRNKNEIKSYKNKVYKTVIAVSYCQKPLNCPAGRFNDRCIYENSSPCNNCPVGDIKHKAELNNIEFTILTTSFEFARFHLRKISHSAYSRRVLYIISVCPYVLFLSKMFAFILNIKIVPFFLTKGGCKNKYEFLKAENGEKAIVTKCSHNAHRNFIELMDYLR